MTSTSSPQRGKPNSSSPPTPSTEETQLRGLAEKMGRQAYAVHLAAEKGPADDLSDSLRRGHDAIIALLDRITAAEGERDEAKWELAKSEQERHDMGDLRTSLTEAEAERDEWQQAGSSAMDRCRETHGKHFLLVGGHLGSGDGAFASVPFHEEPICASTIARLRHAIHYQNPNWRDEDIDAFVELAALGDVRGDDESLHPAERDEQHGRGLPDSARGNVRQ